MNHERLSVSVELTAIPGAQIQTAQDGTLVLVVPLNSESDLTPYVDKNGKNRVYLGLNLWPKRNVNADGVDQYGFSHDAQQQYSQGKRATLPMGTYAPNIGRAKPIPQRGAAPSTAAPSPQIQQAQAQGFVAVNQNPPLKQPQQKTDLPF